MSRDAVWGRQPLAASRQSAGDAMRVLKFGGTSVADAGAVRRLLAIVARERAAAGEGPLVVVSALAGVTDRLLAMAGRAGAGDEAGARALVDDHRAPRRARSRARTARRARPWRRSSTRDRRPRGARAGACGAARGVAAHARRDRRGRRAAQQPHRRGGARGRGVPAAWVDARTVLVTDDEHTARRPTWRRRPRSSRRSAPLCRGRVPVVGGFVGATANGAHDHARPRRLRLLGALFGAASAPTRSRSGPTWTACSPPTRGSCRPAARAGSSRSTRPRSSPTSARRCCTRARSCPPSARGSPCAS
jgi:hypothetical protein